MEERNFVENSPTVKSYDSEWSPVVHFAAYLYL